MAHHNKYTARGLVIIERGEARPLVFAGGNDDFRGHTAGLIAVCHDREA